MSFHFPFWCYGQTLWPNHLLFYLFFLIVANHWGWSGIQGRHLKEPLAVLHSMTSTQRTHSRAIATGTMEEHCLLAHPLLLTVSLFLTKLSYRTQEHLPPRNATTYSGLGPLTSNSNQNNYPQTSSLANGISITTQSRFPSQMASDCIKLTTNANLDTLPLVNLTQHFGTVTSLQPPLSQVY